MTTQAYHRSRTIEVCWLTFLVGGLGGFLLDKYGAVMEANLKPQRDSFFFLFLAYWLGARFVQYLFDGRSLEPLGGFLCLFFAGLFFWTWSLELPTNIARLQRLQANRRSRMWLSVLKGLTGLWAAIGCGAFLVWWWFVDSTQISLEAMRKAEDWNRILFGAVVGAALLIGCYFGYRGVAIARRPSEGDAQNLAKTSDGANSTL